MHDTNTIPDTAQLVRLVQALIRNSFDIIKVVDRDLKTIFVSPTVETVLGYTPRELIGTNPLDFVHPDDMEAAREEMNTYRAHGPDDSKDAACAPPRWHLALRRFGRA
jgi:PAS domain S-box-containing protein